METQWQTCFVSSVDRAARFWQLTGSAPLRSTFQPPWIISSTWAHPASWPWLSNRSMSREHRPTRPGCWPLVQEEWSQVTRTAARRPRCSAASGRWTLEAPRVQPQGDAGRERHVVKRSRPTQRPTK